MAYAFHTYMHTYMHTYIFILAEGRALNVFIHTFRYIYIYIYTYIHIHTHTYTYIQGKPPTYTSKRRKDLVDSKSTHMNLHLCTHVHTHVYTCVHMFIPIYKYTCTREYVYCRVKQRPGTNKTTYMNLYVCA